MRMWGREPKKMCSQHLLGEHLEMHMFLGHLKEQKRINGYVEHNELDVTKIKERHDSLVEEMIRRGVNHKTPLEFNVDLTYLPSSILERTLNIEESNNLLVQRCEKCRQRENV